MLGVGAIHISYLRGCSVEKGGAQDTGLSLESEDGSSEAQGSVDLRHSDLL